MKKIQEIEEMIVSELNTYLERNEVIIPKLNYYNDLLGDTSFLLAGLLESLLKTKANHWNTDSWIDDSLLTEITVSNNILSIKGIIIWGLEDTTSQWTEPFSFTIKLLQNKIISIDYTISFGDLDNPPITYEEFNKNRNYWDNNPKNWNYVFKSDRK